MQRFEGLEDQAWTNFNEKTKVQAKRFKAFYEQMEEMESADNRSHPPTDDKCPWNKKGIKHANAPAHTKQMHQDMS